MHCPKAIPTAELLHDQFLVLVTVFATNLIQVDEQVPYRHHFECNCMQPSSNCSIVMLKAHRDKFHFLKLQFNK